MNRILIFTGKGGVGKSSVSSAHAVKAAKEGKKTLIVSTDMAHNLSDIFSMEIKNEPIKIRENLWGLEIDPNHEMELRYSSIRDAVNNFLKFGSDTKESLEDIIVFPGMEEIFSLLKIMDIYEKEAYDVIIIDCAPTGETLSLLKFPELLGWYVEKLFPIEKAALKVFRPVSKKLFRLELPSEKSLNDAEKLYVKLMKLQGLLKDRELCSIRLVTIPEKMVVEETKRSFMYLNLYNFNVDGMYINRIIPKEIENNFFDEWKKLQGNYIKEIESVFAPLPIYKIKWYETDVDGIEGLERIVQDSLEDKKIFQVQKVEKPQNFIKTEDGYRLDVYLPFIKGKDFDLYESASDIIVKVDNFKRNIPCPSTLKNYIIGKAKFNNDYLSIYFQKGVE
jgi:arsenite-transporting ATPase